MSQSPVDEQLTGRVVSVEENRFGSRLTAAASIADTVLHVEQTGDFDDEAGGQVLVGGDLYDYSDVDEEALTITIDPPLTVASAVDDPVDIFDPEVGTITVEYVALVLLDDQDPDDEPLEVGINHALFDFLAETIRGGPAETITLVPDGPDDWVIWQIDGKLADNIAVDAAVAVAGDAIAQAEAALTTAQLAQAILDGEIDYYYTTSAPWADGSGAHDDDLGDVWVDTDSIPQHAYRWLNRTWTLMADGGLVAALFAAQAAQVTADGKIVHFVGGLATFGGSPPVAEGYGDEWTDTDHDNLRKYWDGDSWEPLVAGDDAIVGELISKILTAGVIRTAASGVRTELTPVGTTGGRLVFYNSGGTAVGEVSSPASNGVFIGNIAHSVILSPSGIAFSTSGIIDVGAQMELGGNAIHDCGALNNGGNDITMDAVIKPDECYLTDLPASSGGTAVQMGGSGRLFKLTSSLRYKEAVEDAEVDVAKVLAVQPRSFQYKSDYANPDDPGRRFIGVIAEEVEALGVTDWLAYDADGNVESFDYAGFSIGLLAVAKQQAAQIADLTARIEQLEA